MTIFRNHYTCYWCGYEWQDEWPAACDDDCPECGARHVSRHKSEDVDTSGAMSVLRQKSTSGVVVPNVLFGAASGQAAYGFPILRSSPLARRLRRR